MYLIENVCEFNLEDYCQHNLNTEEEKNTSRIEHTGVILARLNGEEKSVSLSFKFSKSS